MRKQEEAQQLKKQLEVKQLRTQQKAEQVRKQLKAIGWRKQQEAKQLRKQKETQQLKTQLEVKQVRNQKEAECVQRIAKERVAESTQKPGEQEVQYNKEAKDLKPYVPGNKVCKKRELTKQLDERSHEVLSKGKILQRNRVRPQQTTESLPTKSQIMSNNQASLKP